MKRTVPVLLSLLLLVGCLLIPGSGTLAENAGPTPAPADGPQVTGPFLSYRFFEQEGWENRTSGVMFEADLDQDGVAEPVSFALRTDDWATAITWGKSTVVLKSDEFVEAAVLDLDPASPFYNLLVVVDYGSDSYGPVELHPENGRLVRGRSISGDYRITDDGLRFCERSDLLGTNFGYRTYHGDELIPDSVWLDMKPPTEEELKADLADLIDYGVVIHCAKPVPCVIDSQAATLPAGTCLYCLRFMDPDVDLVMEVRTLEGVVAQLFFFDDEDEPHDPDRMYEYEQNEYFDNLFLAD